MPSGGTCGDGWSMLERPYPSFMRGWKLTRVGRVLVVVLVVSIAVAFFVSEPSSAIASLIAGAIAFVWAMDSFAGATRGGYVHRSPMAEAERVALFRRLYRPRGR